MATSCFALPTLPLAGLGIAGIVGGTAIIGHATDTDEPRGKIAGNIVYILGWIVLVMAASMRYEKASAGQPASVSFSWRSFFWAGLPALIVMGATIGMYTIMLSPDRQQYVNYALGAFALTWTVFAIGLSFKDGAFNFTRFMLAVLSGLSILTGMWFLSKHRTFQPSTGSKTGPSFVFGPGMPLYVLGWIGTALAVGFVGGCDVC